MSTQRKGTLEIRDMIDNKLLRHRNFQTPLAILNAPALSVRALQQKRVT